jgi:hypothetical protein
MVWRHNRFADKAVAVLLRLAHLWPWAASGFNRPQGALNRRDLVSPPCAALRDGATHSRPGGLRDTAVVLPDAAPTPPDNCTGSWPGHASASSNDAEAWHRPRGISVQPRQHPKLRLGVAPRYAVGHICCLALCSPGHGAGAGLSYVDCGMCGERPVTCVAWLPSAARDKRVFTSGRTDSKTITFGQNRSKSRPILAKPIAK